MALVAAVLANSGMSLASSARFDDAELRVKVVDEDGKPLVRVRVSLHPTDAELDALGGGGPVRIIAVHTDEEGKVSIPVPAGVARSVRLMSRDSGVESKVVEFEAIPEGDWLDLDVVLRTRDDATFVALLRDSVTDQPVAGVVVASVVRGTSVSFRTDSIPLVAPQIPAATSDSKGRIELSAATWRKNDITLFAEGYGIRRLRIGGSPDAPGIKKPLTVTLERESLIQVLLVDPPPLVTVVAEMFARQLYEPDLPLTEPSSVSRFVLSGAPLDSDGTWVIRGVPPNTTLRVKVLRDSKVISQREAVGTGNAGTETKIALDLSSNGHVVVTVVDEAGNPRPDEEIWFGPRGGQIGGRFESYEKPQGTRKTDAEGRAVIEGLRPGPHRISLAPIPIGTTAKEIGTAVVVDVDASGLARDVELRIYEGRSIKGRIVGPDGKPASAHVFAYGGYDSSPGGCSAQDSFRGPNGAFEIGPLLPGEYTLNGTSLRSGGRLAGSISQKVEAGTADVLVTLRAVGSIEVRCVDESGAPVTKADLRFHDSESRRQKAARLDADGRYTFDSVAVGTHHLMARTTDGRISDWIAVEIEDSSLLEDVRVVVREQGTLVLTCDDRTGLEPRPINYTIRGDAGHKYVETMSAGETRRLPVPAGKVTLELGRLEYPERPSFEFEFEMGETIEHHAELKPAKAPDEVPGPNDR